MDATAISETSAAACANLRVTLEFGRKVMTTDRVEELKVGSIVELDAFADDYVELYADGRLIARGRPIVVEGKLGIRVQEVLGGHVQSQSIL